MSENNVDSWTLLRKFRNILDKYGHTISANEYDKIIDGDKPSRSTTRRYIGVWQVCVSKALELSDIKSGNTTTGELINIVRLCDWHVPYHDEDVLNCAVNFCGRIQPDIIVVDELHDFYALSRFDKDPKRISSLQDELDEVEKYLGVIRELCPKAKIIMLESNHQARLKKYIWRTATSLCSLRCLDTPTLMQLDKYGIEFFATFTYRNFLFKHGSVIRKHGGYTAKAEFDREGMSGCSGHSHRIGQYYVTKRGGEYTWMECGCLCKREDVEYIDGTADWQHGIGMIGFKKDSDHFVARVIPIIDNEILWV